MILRLFNVGLRLGSLGLKLILTLYIGKYLGLEDMGTFGLVSAYIAIAIPLLGFRTDYVASRDIVHLKDLELACRMRDQGVLYGITYLLLVVISFAAYVIFPDHIGFTILLTTLGLCVLESIATVTASNLISLHRPILSNILFFVRSALWIVPVIGLGIFYPEFRNTETIFVLWTIGVIASLAINAWVWRNLPWTNVMTTKIDWDWMKSSTLKCIPIWIGAVSMAAAGNVNRFVVEMHLGRSFVGISSFYGSFVTSILALLGSGVFAFAFPHLIEMHKKEQPKEFDEFARKMGMQAIISTTFLSVVMGVVVPYLGQYIGKVELFEHRDVLWAVLFGNWLRCATEHFYYVMYARHQDRQVWVGNFIYMIAATILNAALVPVTGFMGTGYAAILSALVLGVWRVYCVRKPKYI